MYSSEYTEIHSTGDCCRSNGARLLGAIGQGGNGFTATPDGCEELCDSTLDCLYFSHSEKWDNCQLCSECDLTTSGNAKYYTSWAANCVWGEWEIGQCSTTSGLGVRENTRIKLVEEAKGGLCSEKYTETEECCPAPGGTVQDCPECWFEPVRPESCPPEPWLLKRCSVPTTKGEICEATCDNRCDNFVFPAGTDNFVSCGGYHVYSTDCPEVPYDCDNGPGAADIRTSGIPGASGIYSCKYGDEAKGFCTQYWFNSVCRKQCGNCELCGFTSRPKNSLYV